MLMPGGKGEGQCHGVKEHIVVGHDDHDGADVGVLREEPRVEGR